MQIFQFVFQLIFSFGFIQINGLSELPIWYQLYGIRQLKHVVIIWYPLSDNATEKEIENMRNLARTSSTLPPRRPSVGYPEYSSVYKQLCSLSHVWVIYICVDRGMPILDFA